MLKHTAEIHESSEAGFISPYTDPFINIYEVKQLRKVTDEIFHNQWKGKLTASTKCDTYRLFKDTMKFETYLLHPNRKENLEITSIGWFWLVALVGQLFKGLS